VIAIPLSGFLSRALGTRLLFAISLAASRSRAWCVGFTSSIEQMILWRAIQGFLGAGMIPTVFASAYTVFRALKFHIVGPIIGLVATLAPTIGRPLAASSPDAMSWHWLFFINVVPGRHHHRGRAGAGRFRSAEFQIARSFRLVRPDRDGGVLGRWNMCYEEGPQYEWMQDTSVGDLRLGLRDFRNRLLLPRC